MLKVLLPAVMLILMLGAFTACACDEDDAPPVQQQPGQQGPQDNVETPPNVPGEAVRVGVSMPTMDLQRWNQDGANLNRLLSARGFDVDLQFAANDVPTQVAQIENMIGAGAEILVIAAIDGDSLTEVLAQAYERDITVIAYDRLIMNTPAVSYYATFDNFLVGVMQGEFVRDALDLPNQDGPFYIEFFTGDPGDNNINFFFPGAMSILQPFLDDGTLVSPSGQTAIAQVATIAWSSENAQTRMENLIALNNLTPGGNPLHAVMCSNDSTAQGVTQALRNAGWEADGFPIITGQDCDIISVRNMIAGYQAMSVFKDTRVLAENVVEMVAAIAEGREVPINNTTDYNNGVLYIPTYLSDPIVATLDNYRELLIDGGYYTEAELYG
ncbi:MAG: sugar-binding protein [Defluviitaleaceae bacterium]|nr:sugar-binding protein [Defluviitaleaceae bacterium]